MLKGKTILLAILLLYAAAAGHATPEYAEQSGKSCSFCHAGPNGGPLEPVGIAFIRNGYSYPVAERILDKSIALSSGFHKILRLILGIIHLLTAAILVGTIFYIHIIVKPHNLKGGVPGGERRMGLSCMSILAATGGICPVARCAKRLLNGPCGGSAGGRCEISAIVGRHIDCVWQLIIDRLKVLGRMDEYVDFRTPKDWSPETAKGPRTLDHTKEQS